MKEANLTPDKLLKGTPGCLLPFMMHVATLKFEEAPDYNRLLSLLQVSVANCVVADSLSSALTRLN